MDIFRIILLVFISYLTQENNAEYIVIELMFQKTIHNTYMAEISELSELPAETAFILYWNTVGAFGSVMQQIHHHMQSTFTAI